MRIAVHFYNGIDYVFIVINRLRALKRGQYGDYIAGGKKPLLYFVFIDNPITPIGTRRGKKWYSGIANCFIRRSFCRNRPCSQTAKRPRNKKLVASESAFLA
jgi:hypothetical protein